MIGQTISHYKILDKIGEGGMGVVYKAQDTKLGRTVALKFLPQHLSASDQEKARFVQEAKAASALNHPNIITIHDIDEYEGQLFMVIEYLEGKSLKELARENLDMNKILEIGIQICAGLQAAHEKQIIHRDIKPENIMVKPDGQVKIMDFGLAKLKRTDKLTQTGFTAGTLPYMSPEQLQGEEVDHRSDIFSFGVVLYELITGKHPFEEKHPEAIKYAIVNEEPQLLARFNKQTPQELERIVQKLLEKDKRNRYQHVEDVLVDLRKLKGKSQKVPKPSPRKLLAIGILLFFVAVSIGLFWKFIRNKPISLGEEPSIAVLYFENMSAIKDDDYFAAGMTEDVITQLAKISGLRVSSRSEAEQFKEKPVNLKKIGEKLRVSYVLEGSVRKAAGKVRITAQLIHIQDGFHIWAENYDKKFEDIFTIQDEVAKKVAQALRVKLAPQEIAEIEKIPTKNLQAYDYFLKGREYNWGDVTSFTKEKIDLAVKFLEKAIQLDSNFALAYVELGEAYTSYNYRFIDLNPVWLEKAEHSIEKALKMDQNLPPAHRALGRLYASQSRVEKALQEFQEALKLKSNYTEAYYSLGMLYAENIEDFKSAIKNYRVVLNLRPTNIANLLELTYAFLLSNKLDSASFYLRQVQNLDPALSRTYYYWGLIKLRENQIDSAIFFFDQAVKYSLTFRDRLLLAERLIIIGQNQRAIKILSQSQDPLFAFANHYLLGWAYKREGDAVKSKAYFDKALAASQEALAVLGEEKTYYQHLIVGVVHALRGDYKLAEGKVEIALRLAEQDRNGEAISTVALGATYIYVLEKKYDKAFLSLTKATRNYYYSVSEIMLDPRLEDFRKSPKFQEFLKNYAI